MDELPIRQQELRRSGPEQGEVTPHQGDAFLGIAAAGPVQNRPHQWLPKPPRRDRRHQDADVARAGFPVRPIKAQTPGPGQAEEPNREACRPVLGKADMLEEALRPPAGRRNRNRPRAPAGRMTEVHRAGADHGHDQTARRLKPRLARRHMRRQPRREGGDRFVAHGDVPLPGRVHEKTTFQRPQPPSVVQRGGQVRSPANRRGNTVFRPTGRSFELVDPRDALPPQNCPSRT